jgi:hypothetical protein
MVADDGLTGLFVPMFPKPQYFNADIIGAKIAALECEGRKCLAPVGVRARSVQSNAAVDDQLRADNVARILRQQESCCPGHFVGCAEPFQERLGGKRFFKPFQLVSGKADFL